LTKERIDDLLNCIFKKISNGYFELIIGVVSQKGGVGKSTLARLIAREYAQAGWRVKIADLDIQQCTAFSWQARRPRTIRSRLSRSSASAPWRKRCRPPTPMT
jgi:Mrp family chromosome partitioning ATPase